MCQFTMTFSMYDFSLQSREYKMKFEVMKSELTESFCELDWLKAMDSGMTVYFPFLVIAKLGRNSLLAPARRWLWIVVGMSSRVRLRRVYECAYSAVDKQIRCLRPSEDGWGSPPSA